MKDWFETRKLVLKSSTVECPCCGTILEVRVKHKTQKEFFDNGGSTEFEHDSNWVKV